MRDGVDLTAYAPEDIEAILNDETLLGVEKYHAHRHPRATLLAGQPGAGKTELSSSIATSLAGDVAFINGDDYRRYHPNYRRLFREFGPDAVGMISPFSNAVVERMIEEFSNRRFHLIIEGTGRTVEVPRSTAERLSGKGYAVELAVMAVRPEVSLCSTLLRFYEMAERGTIPRATALEAHDRVVAALPGNLDILNGIPAISRLTIWTRDLEVIFDSQEHMGSPGAALSQFWSRPWSDAERQAIERDIVLLRRKEQNSHLGQMAEIQELAHRMCQSFHEPEQGMSGMTML